jgi:hypothetical protein
VNPKRIQFLLERAQSRKLTPQILEGGPPDGASEGPSEDR